MEKLQPKVVSIAYQSKAMPTIAQRSYPEPRPCSIASQTVRAPSLPNRVCRPLTRRSGWAFWTV